MTKIEKDKKTVALMINLYIKHQVKDEKERERYTELIDFAHRRLSNCGFGNMKPSCKSCPIHCYPQQKRDMMKKVMRWAGPRMIFYAPMATLRHIMNR